MCQPLLPRGQVKAGTRKRRKKGRHGLDTWKDYMERQTDQQTTTKNKLVTLLLEWISHLSCGKLKILRPNQWNLMVLVGCKLPDLLVLRHNALHTHDVLLEAWRRCWRMNSESKQVCLHAHNRHYLQSYPLYNNKHLNSWQNMKGLIWRSNS